jgi:hypothetical protein
MVFDSYTIDIYEELNNKLKIFTSKKTRHYRHHILLSDESLLCSSVSDDRRNQSYRYIRESFHIMIEINLNFI